MTNDGPHHPLRADLPIWLGAEGPKNVAQTAEIADGWSPIFYTPKSAAMYQPWLDEGFARPGARRTRADFEISATCHLQVVSSAEEKFAVLDRLRPSIALYMGGMGAEEQNFHTQVFDRMGYGDLARKVQRLFLSGQQDAAVRLVPNELIDDMHIIGTPAEVRRKATEWEESGVTTLLLSLRTPAAIAEAARLLG